MNYTDEFETVLALLGVRSRDGRILSTSGEWTARPEIVLTHASSGTEVGLIQKVWVDENDQLKAWGMAMPGIAQALNSGSHKVAMAMDGTGTMTIQPENTIVFVSGRVHAAILVNAQDWLWAA